MGRAKRPRVSELVDQPAPDRRRRPAARRTALLTRARFESQSCRKSSRESSSSRKVGGGGSGSWLLLTLLALLAFGLAVAGSDPPFRHRLADAIHLFPSGFPARPGSGESSLLTVAKYLAAFVSLSLTLGVITAVYARSFIVFRARRRRGHAVIFGLGEKGFAAPVLFAKRAPRSPASISTGAAMRRTTCGPAEPSSSRATQRRPTSCPRRALTGRRMSSALVMKTALTRALPLRWHGARRRGRQGSPGPHPLGRPPRGEARDR